MLRKPMLQSQQTMNKRSIYFSSLLMAFSTLTFAQVGNDSIGTQTVNIEKAFNPAVEEAKMIKSGPESANSDSVKKIDVKYEIQSIPVASIFNPAKPRARQLIVKNSNHFYNNQALLLAGNYGTAIAEFSGAFDLRSNQKLSALIDLHTSQGGVAENFLEDDFSKSNAELTYSSITRSNEWSIFGSVGFQQNQWYGTPKGLWTDEQLNTIDEGHNWTTYGLGSTLKPDSEWLSNLQVKLLGLSDNYNNSELVAQATLIATFPSLEDVFKSELSAKYRNNKREEGAATIADNLLLSFSPTLKVRSGDLSLDLGATGFYQITEEVQASSFLVVPNVHLSYLVDDVILRLNATGNIDQHAYREFLSMNNFFSPNNNILSEEIPYHISLEAETQLSNDFGLNLGLSYENANRKSILVLNEITDDLNRDYNFGNSFGLRLDDVKTTSVQAGLLFSGIEKTTIYVSGQYNNFSMTNSPQFYNRPKVEAKLIVNASLSDRWTLNLSGIIYGQRKDLLVSSNTAFGALNETIDVSGFADINLNSTFQLSDRWSIEARVNNILDAKQARWGFYNVQGIQGLIGLRYNFDW